MNTPSICRPPRGVCLGRRAVQALRSIRNRRSMLLPAILGGLMSGGCTFSGGEFLYMLGVGRGQKVEAKFHLTEGPVLILIDDAAQRVDRPTAARHLFDELAQELLEHRAAKKLVPRGTLEHLRQVMPEFERRGCREIGRRAGADQVLWIEVRDFLAEEQIQDATVAAYFVVTVKVVDAAETKHRARVRLWPISPDGHSITASMAGSEVAMAKTKDAIGKQLAEQLAEKIAKLFYVHRLGDFERQQ